jgi:hypothetical protein
LLKIGEWDLAESTAYCSPRSPYIYYFVLVVLKQTLLYKIRFALKQERFDNLGQWKYNDATNKEWNKRALSWPVKEDGNLNEVNNGYNYLVSKASCAR